MLDSELPSFPEFDALTLDPRGPKGNAWGLFGKNDELGMINLLTPSTIAAASKEIKEGTRMSLDWTLDKPSMPSFGRQSFKHTRVRKAPKWVTDDILEFNTQCSSQWDGLKHYAHQTLQLYYNGHTQQEIQETPVLGLGNSEVVTQGGICGRGVLIDWADYAEGNSIPITPFESSPILLSDNKKIIAEQKIEFRQGDIVFLRTGYSSTYDYLTESDQNSIASRPSDDFIGLEATKEVVEWCWKNKFAAVASDTPNFERAPVIGPHHDPEYVLHEWLLCGWGMLIGELFNLENLAEKCKQAGSWSFFLAGVPLNVPGGVASPPNAGFLLSKTGGRTRPVRTHWHLEPHRMKYTKSLDYNI